MANVDSLNGISLSEQEVLERAKKEFMEELKPELLSYRKSLCNLGNKKEEK